LFKDVIPKVASTDLCYKAVSFYLGEHPSLVNDLLTALVNRVDHSRVVGLVRRSNLLPLVKPYLTSVQEKNVAAVNEALNELYVEEADWESLRHSIDHFDNFDNIQLAQSLEKHELLEFRRISAYIYRNNARWAQSVELSKSDKLYKDAIQTAAESKKADVAEGLLEFFVKQGLKECFAAALYTCYDVIKPDVAVELAWRNNILDSAFPFLIQVLREYTGKVDMLVKEKEKADKEKEKKQEQPGFHAEPQSGFLNQTPQIAYYPTEPVPPTGFGGIPQPGYGGGFGGAPQPGFGGIPPQSGFGGGFGGGF